MSLVLSYLLKNCFKSGFIKLSSQKNEKQSAITVKNIMNNIFLFSNISSTCYIKTILNYAMDTV